MSKGVDPAKRTLRPADVPKRNRVCRKELEDCDRIWARPFAERPGLVPSDRSGGGEANQREPARDVHDRRCARCVKAQPADGAVRQGRVDASMLEPPVDLIEYALDGGGSQPRKQAPAGRETAVRAKQML